jgi:hypothetical protein
MRMQLKPRSALAALSACALSLPGLAAEPPPDSELRYQFNRYREADVPGSRAFGGNDTPRYEIDSHQLIWREPVPDDGREWGLTAEYETLSGASPWFVTEDDGHPVQVMSGATIDEQRYVASVRHRWYGPAGASALSGGTSIENDYRALSLGFDQWRDSDSRRFTFSYGLSASFDEIEPTDGGPDGRFPTRIERASKRSFSGFLGLSDTLNRRSIVQYGLGLTRHSGYLSDPYKLAEVAGVAVQDSRPDARTQVTVSVRLRHALETLRTVLHADYRWYTDDWDINAHTLDLLALQPLSAGLRAELGLRYHSQSQAGFYQPFFRAERQDGYYSSDYRLSPYGALSLRAGLNQDWARVTVGLHVEHYQSKGNLALGKVEVEHPGLVEFTTLSLRFAWRY